MRMKARTTSTLRATLLRLDKIMISPLVSKVNNPSHRADFAAHRDCSAVEAAPLLDVLRRGIGRLPTGNKGTIRLQR